VWNYLPKISMETELESCLFTWFTLDSIDTTHLFVYTWIKDIFTHKNIDSRSQHATCPRSAFSLCVFCRSTCVLHTLRPANGNLSRVPSVQHSTELSFFNTSLLHIIQHTHSTFSFSTSFNTPIATPLPCLTLLQHHCTWSNM
jgi:hypothetical protein